MNDTDVLFVFWNVVEQDIPVVLTLSRLLHAKRCLIWFGLLKARCLLTSV